MIEHEKVLMLAQLADSLEQSSEELKQAYSKNDKKRFDNSREAILDFQNKINVLINEK